jgi:hypothetical protein
LQVLFDIVDPGLLTFGCLLAPVISSVAQLHDTEVEVQTYVPLDVALRYRILVTGSPTLLVGAVEVHFLLEALVVVLVSVLKDMLEHLVIEEQSECVVLGVDLFNVPGAVYLLWCADDTSRKGSVMKNFFGSLSLISSGDHWNWL